MDVPIKALEGAVKQFSHKKGIIRVLQMLKSAKANVNDLWSRESQQLYEQKIHQICSAWGAFVNGAEKLSTTEFRQCQVRLNTAQQVAITVRGFPLAEYM